MKGVVFTEFLEFVEKEYGFDMLDLTIEKSKVPNDGAYTQAGNYPFEEVIALFTALSTETKEDLNILIQRYGEYLFKRLATLYPNIKEFKSAFDIISHVDNIIHPEVKKLYPDADLPEFTILKQTSTRILLQYKSNKNLHQLAKGLMMGASKFYNENLIIIVHEDKNPIEIEAILNE